MGLPALMTLPELTDIPSARPIPQTGAPAGTTGLANPVDWITGWGNNATVNTPGAAAPASSSASSSGLYGSLGTLAKWAAALVSSPTEKTGLSLEDILFVVIGLVLIAAAFFTFHETQSVIQKATKTVRGAADKAVLAAVA